MHFESDIKKIWVIILTLLLISCSDKTSLGNNLEDDSEEIPLASEKISMKFLITDSIENNVDLSNVNINISVNGTTYFTGSPNLETSSVKFDSISSGYYDIKISYNKHHDRLFRYSMESVKKYTISPLIVQMQKIIPKIILSFDIINDLNIPIEKTNISITIFSDSNLVHSSFISS